ncbi:porin family protein [Vreelandella profundi]|uniref:porin family protein n=1 Tax=Vreelandella profundi TaxID=2852117 RepID=UPI001F484BB1|nr:porin family protein [Halomonas profundi]
MKKIILISALASTFALANSTAFAESAGSAYVGALASHYVFDIDGESDDLNPTGLTVRGGYFFTDNFAVEGRLGTGLADDNISGTNVDVELDQLMGVYVAGFLPVNDVFSFYGLLGFSYAEATLSNRFASISDDDDGFSYGAGVEFDFTQQISGQLEYVSYLSKSEYDLSAASIGLSYNF